MEAPRFKTEAIPFERARAFRATHAPHADLIEDHWDASSEHFGLFVDDALAAIFRIVHAVDGKLPACEHWGAARVDQDDVQFGRFLAEPALLLPHGRGAFANFFRGYFGVYLRSARHRVYVALLEGGAFSVRRFRALGFIDTGASYVDERYGATMFILVRRSEQRVKRTLLLNPGPVTLSERVRRALLREDLCHRDQGYRDVQRDVQARLMRIYPEAADTYVPLLISGSGTAAVEAMIGTLVPRDGKVLVLANGVYGERIATMLRYQGKPYEMLEMDWTASIDVRRVAELLEREERFTHVAAIHHETTTGRLNPIAALGATCRRHGVALLLDGVSSFGAEDIRFHAWEIEACAATANKCLHGVPGISFVLVRKEALARESGATSLYLDLWRYAESAATGEPPFTPAVHVLFALQEALRELEDSGGWRRRHEIYKALSHKVMHGLHALGIDTFLGEKELYSSVLVSYWVPRHLSYTALRDHLKEAGFVIYPGQGRFAGIIFRISTMGDVTEGDIDRFLEAMRGIVAPSGKRNRVPFRQPIARGSFVE